MALISKQVLLVDDEEKLLVSISQRLKLMGFSPHTATNGKAAMGIASQHPIELAIVDLQMPDMDGLVTITKLKEIRPNLKTILLTGHGNEKIKQITESLHTSYFEKDEMGDFWSFIKKLNADGKEVVIRPVTGTTGRDHGARGNEIQFDSSRNQTNRFQALNDTLDAGTDRAAPKIIGETSAMQELRKNIERLAALDCAAILRGETGTGKELAARVIHQSSRLKNHRFLAINCGCFDNEQLVEQLLGQKDGSLSGAIRQRSGIFWDGLKGTLLFDHVEDMPPQMQIQLLKIIDSIGLSDPQNATRTEHPTRILIATSADLDQLVTAGTFRKDLYYRLNLFELNIPPLRERKDDIPPLAAYFIDKYRHEFQKSANAISNEVIDIFMNYDFPGNVRELEHLIERAVILADHKIIEKKHLPSRFQAESPESTIAGPETFLPLAEIEIRYILKVLKATNGNKSKTAETLGISRAALWRKLKQLKADT